MTRSQITAAFTAEAVALTVVASGLTDADLARCSPCPPWTVGELFCHVLIATGRIAQGLDEPDDESAELVGTRAYYRPDERFSPATNADRIDKARALAERLASADAISAELTRLWQEAARLLQMAPADRTIRTRHGDRMLLTDFACTRVVELAIHGLDLAAALDQQPWMTAEAVGVLADLLLPTGADELQARLGCDRIGLIARLTGRIVLSPAEAALVADARVAQLSLG